MPDADDIPESELEHDLVIDYQGRQLPNKRKRFLHSWDILALLRRGPVQFVESSFTRDRLDRFLWIPTDNLRRYYRARLHKILSEPNSFIDLDACDYHYFLASDWGEFRGLPLVLIEEYH